MGNRKIPFIVGNVYHCYSRGIDTCATFLEDGDYWRFLEGIHLANRHTKVSRRTLRNLTRSDIWKLSNDSPLVRMTAYCLMPNHFHFVLEEIVENGISTFMQRLMTAYTMYFNKKYNRSGGLFTSPFRSKHINDSRYLQRVVLYIHLNPTKLIHEESINHNSAISVEENLTEYQFSSLPDYLGQQRPQCVLIGKVSP